MISVNLYKIKLYVIIYFIILNLFASANRFGCNSNSYKHYKEYSLLTCYHINFLSKNFFEVLIGKNIAN
ncbi:hypothetical protein EXM89_10300 [Clostridium botulinum]|nr:hypothetical protein [Clostridium botulinum]NFB60387.1 hypothetical protein [Clostridium botulinum]